MTENTAITWEDCQMECIRRFGCTDEAAIQTDIVWVAVQAGEIHSRAGLEEWFVD